MAIVDVLRNVHVFVDGRGYAGVADEVDLPKLTVKTEEHRSGGMDASVLLDMGLEKLECSFTMASLSAEILKKWAAPALVPVVFRGALESEDGRVSSVLARCRGKIIEVDFGTWKPGEKSQTKFMVTVRRYTYEQPAGTVIHDIDVDNMTRIVNGVDQLAEQRQALGI